MWHAVFHRNAFFAKGIVRVGECHHPKLSGHIEPMIRSYQRPTATGLEIGCLVYIASGFLWEWSAKWKARSASFSKK